MSRKRIYAGAATVLLLLLSACKMPGSGAGTGFGADGKAAVRIGIAASGIQARTIVPAVALNDVTGWELWGGPSSEGETLRAEFSGTTTTVYLETGTWNFTLNGYKDDDLIVQGSIPNQNVTLEGPNTLSFTVAPVLEGTGTVAITVNLPDGHGITAARVFKDGGEVAGITLSGNTVAFEGAYPARDYFFSIRLYKSAELYGVVSETAQIRDHLRSEKTYTLELADLNRIYSITYHLNGGQFGGGVDDPGYYRSTDVDLTLPIPARSGYNFGGWHDNGSFTGGAIAVILQGSMEDKDFYAKWTVAYTYTVTFDKNGGDAEADPTTKAVTSPATHIDALPAPPTRGSYAFAGWNTATDGSGTGFTATTTVSATITVYAQWTTGDHSFTLDPDAGTMAFSGGTFTLDKSEGGNQIVNVTGSDYANPRWFVDGDLKRTGTGITLNAADYSVGKHFLTLIISKSGVSWSRKIAFSVVE